MLRQRSHLGLLAKVAGLLVTVMGVAGCAQVEPARVVKTGHVQAATVAEMEAQQMDRSAPILIRIFKSESTLEIWKEDRTGRYAPLKSYAICRYSGGLGPKQVEGDHQAPEGFYELTRAQLNPFSHEYLAVNTGYPNAYDRSLGHTGSFLMIHGGCRSVGCYAMTDEAMDEIYGLLYEAFQAGQEKVQLQAYPFRMTAENLSAHATDANAPFWAMLKRGNDTFHAAGLPPAVGVCGQQYVFNANITVQLDPHAPCPPGIGVEMARTMAPPVADLPPPPAAEEVPMSYRQDDSIARLIKDQFRAVH